MLSAKYLHKISCRRLKLPINSEHNSPAVFAESRNHSEVLEVNNPNYERQSAGILCKKVDSFFPHSRLFGMLQGNMFSSCLSVNSLQTKETSHKPKL